MGKNAASLFLLIPSNSTSPPAPLHWVPPSFLTNANCRPVTLPGLMRPVCAASSPGTGPLSSLLLRSTHMRPLHWPIPGGMGPLKELFPSWSIARRWRLLIPAGISPEMRLLARVIQMRLVQLTIDFGMLPVRALLFRISIWRLPPLTQMPSGISPVRLFAHMTTSESWGKLQILAGIGPSNELKLRSIDLRLLQSLSSDGTEPVR
ncbi:disease resistance protein [Striga asiatica]|uniref:Disease resistance protein n=1 Tax=Striga asiatica TaxID=4170 RepID=A0A5A7R640_STRAF|nr:disease resistance protein [Striga asiatica]